MRDPFTPHDVGGPEARWGYAALTGDEKVVVDRGRDVAGWQGVHDGYRQAARERAAQAAAEAAALQLGVDNLATVGVVP